MACKNIAKDYNCLPASSKSAGKVVKIKVEEGEKMEVRPEEELTIDVNGYSNVNSLVGCRDDCDEYFPEVSQYIDGCGWFQTPKTTILW